MRRRLTRLPSRGSPSPDPTPLQEGVPSEWLSRLASVVVVNWNGRQYLSACLSGLAAQTYQPTEVIVVDNGSTDGSVELVQEEFPWVRLVSSSTNLGFAGGCNLGLREARGAYLATLNNDAFAYPNWLEEMVGALESDSSVGMCASKVLAWDDAVAESAGITVSWLGIAAERLAGQPDRPEEEELVEVFGPSASAALYRRAMLDELGLFEESFFCYLEDVDLAWRARNAGWRCLYVPTARVRHRGSATSGRGSALKRYYLARNKPWTIARNYPSPYLPLLLPAIFLADLAAAAYALAFCAPTWEARRAVLRGRLDGWGCLGSALAQRRTLKRQHHLSARQKLKLLTPFAR